MVQSTVYSVHYWILGRVCQSHSVSCREKFGDRGRPVNSILPWLLDAEPQWSLILLCPLKHLD